MCTISHDVDALAKAATGLPLNILRLSNAYCFCYILCDMSNVYL